MVLAAGVGERMRPLTDNCPKPLLEVAGEPLLGRHFSALARAGIREVVVNAAYLADQVVAFCGDGSRWGLQIQMSVESEPLETAGGIVNALPLLGDAPFMVLNGDIYIDHPLRWLRGVVLDPGGAFLVLVPNPEHNPAGDFAHDGLQVLAPEAGDRTWTYAGLGVYDPSFFAGCEPGKQPMKPLLDRAIAASGVRGEIWDGDWVDVGTPERLFELDRKLSNAGRDQRYR